MLRGVFFVADDCLLFKGEFSVDSSNRLLAESLIVLGVVFCI